MLHRSHEDAARRDPEPLAAGTVKFRLVVAAALSLVATFAQDTHAAVPLTGAAAVAAGRFHTCVLTTGGGVKCWGGNGAGQLGNGASTPPALTAVDVPGLTTGVASIAAAGSHTCALSTGGGVKCWGSNSNGQLGNGTTTFLSPPVDVTGLTAGVAAIAAGELHTCALTTGGGVKCWGVGPLGNGTAIASTTAVDVAGLTTGAVAIAAGRTHSCALTTGGGVKCWGRNPYGELGDGTTTDALTPVDVTGLTAGVAAIATGANLSCALSTGGGVKCWGYNAFGQLGNGSTTSSLTPADVTGLTTGVAAIAAGNSHTCAVTTGGGLKCWGYNDDAQLGNGTTTNALTAVDVTGLAAGVAASAAGYSHTCALTAGGGVKCWGLNSSGQLGIGTTTYFSSPVDVTGLSSGVAAIAAGLAHSCALTTGGGVKCWGWNPYGALGNGTTKDALTAVDVAGLTTGVAAIAAGSYHSCALTAGGGVKCWGSGWNGQLGNGTTTDTLTAIDVTGLTAGVAAIAAAGSHTCALTTGSGVKCWGLNALGQLGNGTTTDALTPVDVSGLTAGVTAIAAGNSHTCALTTSGGAKCWGYNAFGQLGNGTQVDAWTPIDVTGLLAGVASITAGSGHSCALTTGGGMKCWGDNVWGQLGNDTTTNVLMPADVTGLASGVAAIMAGRYHTCAVTAGGGVKCWGYNLYGQLGNSTTTDASTAVDVTALSVGVAAITTGSDHTCARTSTGGMKCWGNNFHGQLGNGFARFFPTPQVVIVAACADFIDVDPASAFCANVHWIKNHSITLGCTSATLYCPNDQVLRLAMAAFMNRHGTALSAIPLSRQFATGPLDPGASPVVCQSLDQTETGFPRRVFLDGVFSATASSDVGLAADPVVSFDSGVTWLSLATHGQRGLVRANRWGNLHSLGTFDLAPGQMWRAGLRVSRGGLPSAATLTDSSCNLRVRIDNRNGELQPF